MEKRKKLGVITRPLLNDANEFFTTLRRFSQSKFHVDFEEDSRLGPRRLRSLSRYLLKIAV